MADCTGRFSHWFLTDQREEVASMTELLAVVERGKGNLLHVEEYLARAQAAQSDGGPDLTAPPAAGGAL